MLGGRWQFLIYGFIGCLYMSITSASAQTVSFCFNDWPPYVTVKDGKAQGISIDILSQASRRANLTPTFFEMPWQRCLEMVSKGKIDAVIDAAARKEFLQGDVSHSIYTNTFWVRADDPTTSIDIQNIGDRHIGLVAGYKYGAPLDTHLSNPTIAKVYSKDDPSNVRMLNFKRVDVIIGDFVGTKVLAKSKGYELKPLLPSTSFDRLYPSFNKNRKNLHKKINTELKNLMADGTIDGIYAKAIGIPFTQLIKPKK